VTGKTKPFPGFSTEPLWSERSVSKAFFYIPHGFPNTQGLLFKKNHLSLKVLRNAASPPWSPNTGSLWRKMPVSNAFLYVSFRFSCKGVFPPASSRRASTGTTAPLP